MNGNAGRERWAGVLFTAIGVGALVLGADLSIGTAAEMGEGYVPRAMAIALVVLGGLIVLLGGRDAAEGQAASRTPFRLRPILMLAAAIFAFAAVVERFGLAAAIAASVGIASFAGQPLRMRTLLALIVVLCAAIGAVFVWALGLPLAMWPRAGD